MLHPLGYLLPRLEPPRLLILIRGLQRPVTVLFLDLAHPLVVLLLVGIGLLHGDLNHFLGLQVLSLSPDGHGLATVGLPEHSSHLGQRSSLHVISFILQRILSDLLKGVLLQRLLHDGLEGVGKANVATGVVPPRQENVSQVGLEIHIQVLVSHLHNHLCLQVSISGCLVLSAVNGTLEIVGAVHVILLFTIHD